MRRVVPFVALTMAACGARTNVDVVPAADVVTVEHEDVPPPLACATSYARCKERHAAPIAVSTAGEPIPQFVGDIAAIDAQRLLVAYRPQGLGEGTIAIVGPDGSIGARQRFATKDQKPRVTFHPGFATGVLRSAGTTTVLDAEGRPTIPSTLPSAETGAGTPVIPISLGYLAWSSDARGNAFFQTRASSRGLEWERGTSAIFATELEIARRAEGLPRSFVMTDGRTATVYHVDDDGRPSRGHSNNVTARGFLLGAVENDRGVFALINPIDVGPISLVDMENDTTIVAADGSTFGDVLSLDDQSIVVASAAGDGDITLRSIAEGSSAFGDARTVSRAGQAGMLRMAPTRTGFAMIWLGSTTGGRPSVYYQRWDCCPA